jgi:tRNA A-37 threonylcarbamoyl transferase component Bud32
MPDLFAAIRAEQRAAWQVGRRVSIQEYFKQHPSLGENEDSAIDLIYSEILLREEMNETVAWDEYFQQFPRYAEKLRRQQALHQMMKGLSSSDPQATVPQRMNSDTGETAVLAAPCAAPRMPVVPGYELLQVLGEGSHGIVYLACQLSLGKQVALKMLRHGDSGEADERRLLRRDAEVLAKLDHPNIVRIIDLGEADGRLFYSMEYVKGRSLAERLDTGPLPPREAARLVEAAARALHAVHQQHIIHRDLKPANILLDEHGTPKVADFGLAKRLGADTSLAASGQLVGNIAHMAPEQSEGKPELVGPAADVWALGVILYESLTGRIPFVGKSFLETLDRIRHAEPALLRPLGVDRDLQTICWKCLEKDPVRRYASAEALADDLKRWQAGEPIVARPEGWTRRVRRFVWHQRGKVAIALTIVVTVSAMLAAGTLLRGPSAEELEVRRQQDALAQIESELAAGQPVELIPPTGGPRYQAWRSAHPSQVVTQSPTEAFALQSREYGLVELLRDPRCDSYRFEAEIRHESSNGIRGCVGLYFADFMITTAGDIEHWYCTVEFNDQSDFKQVDRDWPYPGNPVRLMVKRQMESERHPDTLDPSIETFFAPRAPRQQNIWRHLAIEVRPADVRFSWAGQAPRSLPCARLDQITRKHLKSAAGVVPEFHPRGGLGLYVFSSAASFRNVWVIPLHNSGEAP